MGFVIGLVSGIACFIAATLTGSTFAQGASFYIIGVLAGVVAAMRAGGQ